ncbi:acyltransferase [Aureimonas sp. ME7]|uniref:acyltransferase family protein n=1 Tax=Aureimonas sp. ME7 TaxID=2744252 RepID=UPI0015F5C8BB|nr:acyltransferase [Aureimonas sp. ME7]
MAQTSDMERPVPILAPASGPAASVTAVHEPLPLFRQRNRNLQWLRGIAALFVLLYHASTYTEFEFGDTRFSSIFDHEFGLVGVAVFFAISGALMADIIRTTAPAPFLIHRVLRIYPIFFLAAIILPFALGLDGGIDSRALSLVPIGPNGNYRLAVEWTLVFEVFFYVLLFVVTTAGLLRWLNHIAVGWIVLSIASAFLYPALQGRLITYITEMPFMAVNAAFAGGLLIPTLARRHKFQPALAVIAVAFAAVSADLADVGLARLYSAAAAVILVGLALLPEYRGERDTVVTRAATKLGDWSYALYLCHVPIIMSVYTYVPLDPVALWFVAVAASIAVAAPLGMLDLRMYRFLRKRSDRSTPESFRRWAWIFVGAYALVAVIFLFKN